MTMEEEMPFEHQIDRQTGAPLPTILEYRVQQLNLEEQFTSFQFSII